MIPSWITFLIANIICAVGTILNVIDVVKNRDMLRGYLLLGSFITFVAVTGFLIGFGQESQWLSVLFGFITMCYWLSVVIFKIRRELNE